MSIHYMETYLDNLWDWGFLDDCFKPSKIKITDIDGMVERKGRFLLIETKLPDVEIPMGQKILFDSLIASHRFHVLIVWGKRNQPEHRMFWGYTKKIPTNTENLKEIVRRWYQSADSLSITPTLDTVTTITKQGNTAYFQCNTVLDPNKQYHITITETLWKGER